MDPIYVTGHRNPDTDSIVSAIAYAALRNALGDREFVAARLGHVSDETNLILDRFGFQPPVHIQTMRTQVCDLDYDTPPALSGAVTVSRAWDAIRAIRSSASLPVTTDDGGLYGMLSSNEIAAYDIQTITDAHVDSIPVFNLLSVLDGKILNEAGNLVDSVSGEVSIALPQNNPNLLFSSRESIVICGQQPDMARRAIELGVCCLIVCQAELPEDLRNAPTDTCIIATPYDAFKAARMVFHAIPVQRVCRTEELQAFHLTDFVDDVKEIVLKSRHRSYPILDENEKVVGTLSRYHLIKPRRKRVVLVDHNEVSQSVPGSSRRRSWRSSTITAWRIFRPEAPSTSATSRSAPPRRSFPACIRKKDSCRRAIWRDFWRRRSSRIPSCSSRRPPRRSIIGWRSVWRASPMFRWMISARRSSPRPPRTISLRTRCCLRISRISTSRITISASVRSPASIPATCSSAARNFWSLCARLCTSAATAS